METVSQGLLSILVMLSMAGCLARTPTTEPTFAVFEDQGDVVSDAVTDTDDDQSFDRP